MHYFVMISVFCVHISHVDTFYIRQPHTEYMFSKQINHEEKTRKESKNVDGSSFFATLDERNDLLPIRWIRYHNLAAQEAVHGWGATKRATRRNGNGKQK